MDVFKILNLNVGTLRTNYAHARRTFHANIAQLKEQQSTQSLWHLETYLADFNEILNPLIFLKYVSPQKDIRAFCHQVEIESEQILTQIFSDRDIYKAISQSTRLAQKNTLDTKLLADIQLEFKNAGVGYPDQISKNIVKNVHKLTQQKSDYGKTLAEWNKKIKIKKSELAGLPQTYIEKLKGKNGLFEIGLSYPETTPILQHAEKSSLRQRVQKALTLKGGARNLARLKKSLVLRNDIAEAMGFSNHAERALQQRMAKSPEKVFEFLEALYRIVLPALKKELRILQKYQAQKEGSLKLLQDWDWIYYLHQYKKEFLKVDAEQFKPYFSLAKVIDGMLNIFGNFFGITISRINHTGWHKDVLLYQIKNKGGRSPIAYFYMDLFPRPFKYGHAAAFTLRSGRNIGKRYQVPVSAIVCNFTPGMPKKPALLNFNEVETLFHEFGHILHQTLTRSKYAYYAGTQVERDFVETPSQMSEHWLDDYATVSRFARHYENGAPLPETLFHNYLAAKSFGQGIHYARQIMFAWIDMLYHTQKNIDPVKVWEKIQKRIFKIPMPKHAIKAASFGHLMGGYDAGYYGYLWSEVFAHDLFDKIKKSGLDNGKIGLKFRGDILEKGGSVEAQKMLRSFLGRPASAEAFHKFLNS